MSANLAVIVGSCLMIWGFLGYFGFVEPTKLRCPFITRGHYEDVVGELRRQIAEKEAERQKCWDLLAQMGFGTKVFCTSADASLQAVKAAAEPEDTGEGASTPARATPARSGDPGARGTGVSTPDIPIARLRPSQIMRKKDMEKLREYQDKHRLARKAEVLAEITAILDGKAL